MKFAIIVAMGKEMDLLRQLLDDVVERQLEHWRVYTGRMGDNEVVAMQCGIGKVNAAIGAWTIIHQFAPDCVINTGVAGGVGTSVMDVVVGQRVAYHDVWCGPESVLGAVQGLPLYYEADESLLSRITRGPKVKFGLICSGDSFIDRPEQVDTIKAHFPEVLAVDMESGAIAQVCHIAGVPFLSVRVISDSPGAVADNTAQYEDFWAEAPQQTFHVIRDLLR